MQIAQKREEMSGRERQKASLSSQLASYTAEMNAVSPLVVKGYYPRNKYLALERDRARVSAATFSLSRSSAVSIAPAARIAWATPSATPRF
jgi:hypothetical protein